MNLNIKYFGLIAEVTQCNEETLEITETTVYAFLDVLYEKYPNLKDKDFQIALNNELISKNELITGSEIALLPPFSGG